MTYLDHNASSPLLPVARDAWLDAVDRFSANPSSLHRPGTRAERALDEARQQLATVLGCAPPDLIWTSGATEACAAALHHAAATAGPRATAWVSAVEHPAVRENARHFFAGRVEEIPVDARGVVQRDWLTERRRQGERPGVVAVMAANNETGGRQPWREVAAWCAAEGVPFFCDATQWCGRLPGRGLDACDFVAGSAHKFGGPRGVGFLKVPRGQSFFPLLRGGSQLEGRRAGTENVAGVRAMVAALAWCEERIAAGDGEKRATWRDRFEMEVQATLPGVAVNGAGAERLWNTSSLVLPAPDCRQRWVVKLDKAGFAVSTGSACASGAEKPSPVLLAMGRSPAEAGRAVRISAGWTTMAEEWTALRGALERIHAAWTEDAAPEGAS